MSSRNTKPFNNRFQKSIHIWWYRAPPGSAYCCWAGGSGSYSLSLFIHYGWSLDRNRNTAAASWEMNFQASAGIIPEFGRDSIPPPLIGENGGTSLIRQWASRINNLAAARMLLLGATESIFGLKGVGRGHCSQGLVYFPRVGGTTTATLLISGEAPARNIPPPG